VASKHLLKSLEGAIAALSAWFKEQQVPAVFIGGVAASLLGRPRTTQDVDAIVWLPDHEAWGPFLATGARHGVVPRIADPVTFALESRVFLLRHAPSSIDVDISVGALAFEEAAIEQARFADIGRLQIPIPMPEHLIIMKAIAHRPRDMGDIESILDAHPDIDTTRIVATVREFADLLDMPEIVEDLLRLLPPRRSSTAAQKAAVPKRRAAAKKKSSGRKP
jgi:hypothetical protein